MVFYFLYILLGFIGVSLMLALVGWSLFKVSQLAGWFGLKKRPTRSRSKQAAGSSNNQRLNSTASIAKKTYYTAKRLNASQ